MDPDPVEDPPDPDDWYGYLSPEELDDLPHDLPCYHARATEETIEIAECPEVRWRYRTYHVYQCGNRKVMGRNWFKERDGDLCRPWTPPGSETTTSTPPPTPPPPPDDVPCPGGKLLNETREIRQCEFGYWWVDTYPIYWCDGKKVMGNNPIKVEFTGNKCPTVPLGGEQAVSSGTTDKGTAPPPRLGFMPAKAGVAAFELAGANSSLDAIFQNVIAEGGDFQIADPTPSTGRPFAAHHELGASIWSLLTSFFARPGSAASAEWQSGTRWVDPAKQLQRTGAKGQATSTLQGLLVSLIATGNSSGDAFQLQILNRSGVAGRLAVPDGLVLQPVKQLASKALAGAGVPTSFNLSAYCLNFAKLPPKAGALYRIADDAVQRQFKPIRGVLQAARQLTAAGQLHPDSSPDSYATFVKQWAVWTRLEGWDQRQFGEQFVDRTRRNVEAMRQPWTRRLEQAVRGAIPNRWQDVTLILTQADVLNGPTGVP